MNVFDMKTVWTMIDSAITAKGKERTTMTKFIEVHLNGASCLINLAHVEEIICNTKGECVIYFAFPTPNQTSKDIIIPDETYDQIKSKIFGGE